MGQLHEEVSVELDVELKVGGGGLGLLNVQVEGGVEQSDRLGLVPLEPPLQLGLQKGVVRALALVISNLQEELELLGCVLVLLLLDAAVDHSVEWRQVCFVVLGRTLVRLVSAIVVSFEALLEADLALVGSVLRLEHDGHVEHLEGALEHFGLAAAETSENSGNVVNQV